MQAWQRKFKANAKCAGKWCAKYFRKQNDVECKVHK